MVLNEPYSTSLFMPWRHTGEAEVLAPIIINLSGCSN